jgi:hypothetical protein
MSVGRAVIIFAIATLAFWHTYAWAEAFRCRDGLVELGDSMQIVIEKCGQPTRREFVRGRWLVIETWIYDLGPTEFVRILAFDLRGLLRSIGLGDYGSSR